MWVRLMLTAAIHQVFWFITGGACYTATVSAETQRQTWQQSRPSPGDPLTPESIRWEQCNTRHLQQGDGFYNALSYACDTPNVADCG